LEGSARQIVHETLSQKYSSQKTAGGVAQEVEYLASKCVAMSSVSTVRRNCLHIKRNNYQNLLDSYKDDCMNASRTQPD
jgi:hypothetical protein